MIDLIGQFQRMTLAELTAFNRRFQDEFGVDVSPQPAQVPVPAPVEPEVEEPTAFTVTLVTVAEPGGKIHVIKAVRALLGLGLKEAKDLVDTAPVTVLANVDAAAARSAETRLREAGADVTVNAAEAA